MSSTDTVKLRDVKGAQIEQRVAGFSAADSCRKMNTARNTAPTALQIPAGMRSGRCGNTDIAEAIDDAAEGECPRE